MFRKFKIESDLNLFDKLSCSLEFDNIVDGRIGTNIVDCTNYSDCDCDGYTNELIPLVRTTTIYTKPMQKFLPIHYKLVETIKKISCIDFNLWRPQCWHRF